MTQEEKDLLLKDLCSRIPYGVKCQIDTGDADVYVDTLVTITIDGCACFLETIDTEDVLEYGDIKPLLFPLSSMTEEQWNNAPSVNLTEFTFESFQCGEFTLASYTCENELPYLVKFINWLIKNHFDIYGLIPKGLAIDATNLNIY